MENHAEHLLAHVEIAGHTWDLMSVVGNFFTSPRKFFMTFKKVYTGDEENGEFQTFLLPTQTT